MPHDKFMCMQHASGAKLISCGGVSIDTFSAPRRDWRSTQLHLQTNTIAHLAVNKAGEATTAVPKCAKLSAFQREAEIELQSKFSMPSELA